MFADVLTRAYVQKCLGENPDGNKKRFRIGRGLQACDDADAEAAARLAESKKDLGRQ